MTLPLTTTTVTVQRGAGSGDPYESDTLTTVATGIPAHVSSPTGVDQRVGGLQETVDAVLLVPSDVVLARGDRVTDDTTGDVWTVTWRRLRIGLGLDHQKAGLVAVTGGSNG